MSDLTLPQLVNAARLDDACSQGHDWQSDGGRRCTGWEHSVERCIGTQTVYRCARCGEWDYGYKGGPGHAECVKHCLLDDIGSPHG